MPATLELSTIGEWIEWAFVQPWMRRDAVYFHQIAEEGYSLEAGTTAFHPLYPLLSRFFDLVLPDLSAHGGAGLGLLVASTAATIAMVVLVARYVDDVHGDRIEEVGGGALGHRAALALLVMPAGVVWLMPYTESLFVALAVAAMWSARRRRWMTAGLAAAAATLTRQHGLVLVAALGWELYEAHRDDTLRLPALAALLGPPLAYLSFALYRLYDLGGIAAVDASNPLDVLRALLVSQAAAEISPGQRIAPPWEPLVDHIAILWAHPERIHMLLDLALGWGFIGVIVAGFSKMTPAERLYTAGIVALTLCYYNGVIAPYMALPRHVIIAFPLGLLLALRARDADHPRLLAGAGVAINLLLVYLFGTAKWIP
jgi:hypothetical protein